MWEAIIVYHPEKWARSQSFLYKEGWLKKDSSLSTPNNDKIIGLLENFLQKELTMVTNPIEQAARLIFAGLIFVGLCVIGAAILIHRDITVVKSYAQPQALGEAKAQPSEESGEGSLHQNWKSLLRPYNPVLGPEEAPVTMIEFGDFQCPFCARHYLSNHEPLLKKYEGKIRYVYKHFPLTQIHPQAMIASIAAQCAHRQGRFWDYHDLIFRYQQELSEGRLLEWGKKLGLGESFEKCLKERATQAEVEQDLKDGMGAGVRGTPTFFINGRVIPGALPLSTFQEAIDQNL